jgi:hypothetical protein
MSSADITVRELAIRTALQTRPYGQWWTTEDLTKVSNDIEQYIRYGYQVAE